MKLTDINYTPLQRINGAWGTVVRQTFKVHPAVVVVALVIVTIVLLYFIGEIGIYLAVFGFAWIGGRVATYKNTVWKEFAAANGWSVTKSGTTLDATGWIPPGLFGVGSSRKVGDIIHADFEGHACSLYLYEFTTGSGKSRTTHYYTIARVMLERPFPHLVLDSKSTWSLHKKSKFMKKIKLEGNFDKHFSLYFTEGEHIDALSVITPDVMQTLITNNQAQDVEIIGQYLFFMVGSDTRSGAVMPSLLTSVDALSDEIAHKAKTIRYGNNQQPNNEAMLTEMATAYHKSGDQVLRNVVIVILAIILVPFLFIILLGSISALIGR